MVAFVSIFCYLYIKFPVIGVKSTICIFFLFVLSDSFGFSKSGSGVSSKSQDEEIVMLKDYQEAFNHQDTGFLDKFCVNQEEYLDIFKEAESKKVNCLSGFERNYSVRDIYREFMQSVAYSVKMDSVGFTGTTMLKGCGDVELKKIDGTAFFKNFTLELPFSLIFIKNTKQEYKLLMQILNHKILRNE